MENESASLDGCFLPSSHDGKSVSCATMGAVRPMDNSYCHSPHADRADCNLQDLYHAYVKEHPDGPHGVPYDQTTSYQSGRRQSGGGNSAPGHESPRVDADGYYRVPGTGGGSSSR